MWRKNRRPFVSQNAVGVDLNRNWNDNWLRKYIFLSKFFDNFLDSV